MSTGRLILPFDNPLFFGAVGQIVQPDGGRVFRIAAATYTIAGLAGTLDSRFSNGTTCGSSTCGTWDSTVTACRVLGFGAPPGATGPTCGWGSPGGCITASNGSTFVLSGISILYQPSISKFAILVGAGGACGTGPGTGTIAYVKTSGAAGTPAGTYALSSTTQPTWAQPATLTVS